MNVLEKLHKKKLITPPNHVLEGLQYLTIMGSISYGVSNNSSDIDIYGFSIPPKQLVFPHLSGEIQGFGRQTKRFQQFQQHHVIDNDSGKEYDFTIYNIVKYFQLLMDNNPNMADSLFCPRRCVLYCSNIGQMVRDQRKIFLHKGSYYKFRGYAYSQLNKINKKKSDNPKRQKSIEEYGYDVKFAYHVVRLLLEGEQILIEHDLNLEKNSEILKSIRRGDWSLDKLKDWFDQKERQLEELYTKSTLRHKPDEGKIKELLLNCLEMYYGSIDNCIQKDPQSKILINELKEIINKYDR